MAIDVVVYAALPHEADVNDAFRLRERITRETETQRVEGKPIIRAHEVGGGTQFEPPIVDVTYEAKNTLDAFVTVGILATALLKYGYSVTPLDGTLLISKLPDEMVMPKPGKAIIYVLAPLGSS